MEIAAVGVAVLAACTGGASTDQRAEEVASISRPDLEVFMALDATPAESRGVRDVIRHSDQVRTFSYLSQEDALKAFRRLFADQPDLIADTTAADLPSSFVIRLVNARNSRGSSAACSIFPASTR